MRVVLRAFVNLFVWSVVTLQICESYTEILACFSAIVSSKDYTNTTIFNAPVDGEIEGIRLTYINGGMSSDTSFYLYAIWGFKVWRRVYWNTDRFAVSLYHISNASLYSVDSIYYPTNTTEHVLDWDDTSLDDKCSSDKNIDWSEYWMDSSYYNVYSDTLYLRYPKYNVTTDDQFALGVAEAFCQNDNSDNVGFVNASVYFLYNTFAPTNAPTDVPSHSPIAMPTGVPTAVPSMIPTIAPTDAPTHNPIFVPTDIPTVVPSSVPSSHPTPAPTIVPTRAPTDRPSMMPALIPTHAPTDEATDKPSVSPIHITTIDNEPTQIISANHTSDYDTNQSNGIDLLLILVILTAIVILLLCCITVILITRWYTKRDAKTKTDAPATTEIQLVSRPPPQLPMTHTMIPNDARITITKGNSPPLECIPNRQPGMKSTRHARAVPSVTYGAADQESDESSIEQREGIPDMEPQLGEHELTMAQLNTAHVQPLIVDEDESGGSSSEMYQDQRIAPSEEYKL